MVGRDVRLTKGTTTNIDGTGFTFRDFNADRSAMMRGEKTVLVLTDLTITPPDGSQHDMTVKYVFHLDGIQTQGEEFEIPGVPGGKLRVLAVSPERRRRRRAADGRVEEPGRRVPGGDGRVALRSRSRASPSSRSSGAASTS